jgi:hypothetical protein
LTATSENGEVTINDNGTLTFAPNENFNGDTNITLSATDSDGATSTHQIEVPSMLLMMIQRPLMTVASRHKMPP